MTDKHLYNEFSLALSPSASKRCLALAIPPELLGQIFVACLEPKETARVLTIARLAPPLLFCQICRYWRNVALSLPILWSTFSPYFKSTPKKIALFRLWLERSQNHLLTINFSNTLPKSDPALDLLCSHMHHWGDIEVDMGSESAHKLLILRPEMVPFLKRIEIRNNNKVEEDKRCINALTPVLASLSSLSEIVWSGYIPRNLSTVLWPYLRRFVIHKPMDTCQYLLFVARCPMIEEITILYLINSPRDITLPVVNLPHLHTLYLRGYNGDTGQLLDQLVLPSLRSLEMTPPVDNKTLLRLGARSSCNLIRLCLLEGMHALHTLTEQDPLEYLQPACCQTIRSLHIKHATTDALFRHLTWRSLGESGNQYLPHLVELSVQPYTTDGIVSDMVASRWHIRGRAPARLASVDVDLMIFASRIDKGNLVFLPHHTYRRDRAVLGDLAAQGLRLELNPE